MIGSPRCGGHGYEALRVAGGSVGKIGVIAGGSDPHRIEALAKDGEGPETGTCQLVEKALLARAHEPIIRRSGRAHGHRFRDSGAAT